MKVYSTVETVSPFEFDGFLWRVRTNVELVTITNENGSQEMWQYDEQTLTPKEFEQHIASI